MRKKPTGIVILVNSDAYVIEYWHYARSQVDYYEQRRRAKMPCLQGEFMRLNAFDHSIELLDQTITTQYDHVPSCHARYSIYITIRPALHDNISIKPHVTLRFKYPFTLLISMKC